MKAFFAISSKDRLSGNKNMLESKKYSIEVGGRTLSLEFSRLAERASAAVLGRYGETVVLATVVMGHKDIDRDYFPLTVEYEEKFYAAGKIIGSRYVRREGRPSEEAVLSGRLIDRAIRPLFDHRLRREVQVVTTVLAFDEENDPDCLAMICASMALMASDIPWKGPVAGVKVGEVDGVLQVNPLIPSLKAGAKFETFVAGTLDRINMIEFAGLDVPEDRASEAFALAGKEIAKIVALEIKIAGELGKPKAKIEFADPSTELVAEVKAFLKGKLEAAVYTTKKVDGQYPINILKYELMDHLKAKSFDDKAVKAADDLYEEEVNALLHEKILKEEKRPDGRKLDEVRALESHVALFARTHGSAVFMRGNTQALAATTLAAPGQEQLVETMETTGTRRFLLHYNFPPFSTGETKPMRGPGRREIGHGALAEKAVRQVIPTQAEFPYMIRVVSEILSSNGSSSMATICASILSLMDAGVPIKKPVAGIAMGLITEEHAAPGTEPKFKVLTDIQGPEDHHGDMDFKVAGTKDGMNAVQLDVKIDGLTVPMIQATLTQAKAARLHILEHMLKTLATHRPELSKYAPILDTMTIDPTRIGEVIGSGGKVINGSIAKTGALSIDIEDDGRVFVAGTTREAVNAAKKEIEAIVHEYKVGDVIEGNVIKVMEFGAIVDLGGGNDGMIHVSELKQGFVKKVDEVVKLGDFVRAKVIRVEDGRIGLSIKQLSI